MRDARARGGLLARLFCFAPARAGHRVGSLNAASGGSKIRQGARAKGVGRPEQPTVGEAAAGAAAPGTPNSAALAAYLGSCPLPPATPQRDSSTEASVLQASSTYYSSSPGSGGGSGGDTGSGGSRRDGSGAGQQDTGYDADSDCAPSGLSPRRFRPAVRHPASTAGEEAAGLGGLAQSALVVAHKRTSEGGEAPNSAAASQRCPTTVGVLIHSFERLSIGSSSSRSSSSSRARRAAEAAGAGQAAAAAGGSPAGHQLGRPLPPYTDSEPGSTSASACLNPHALSPLADTASMHSPGSAVSLSASGSISLFHFLGAAGSASRSSRSSSWRLRAALPEADTPGSSATSSSAAARGSALSPASSSKQRGGRGSGSGSGGAPVVVAAPPPGAADGQGSKGGGSGPSNGSGQPASAAVVHRRLSEIQSGHHVSLEKLRRQCGNFGEPPGDLLSLMARRVFANRSSLLQRLCSEGVLSDLQAEDSRLQTPSQHTITNSPRSPPAPPRPLQQAPPPPPPQQQQRAAHAELEQAALPQLPRIRTRVAAKQPIA